MTGIKPPKESNALALSNNAVPLLSDLGFQELYLFYYELCVVLKASKRQRFTIILTCIYYGIWKILSIIQ